MVEWLNVSGGVDAPPDWMLAHTQLMRRGHAWAGVSAQRAGIEGGGMVESFHLKKAHPERYAQLSHPGDAWSFDIFSQAASALLATDGLLPRRTDGGRTRLLACGHSQSGAFLVTYVNAVDPLAAVFDGFLVHGRTGSGAALDTGFRPGATADAGGERIRDDLRVPVIVLQTETDVTLLGSGSADQPDSDLLRNWEIAGAAHADTYLLFASGQDDGHMPAALLAELTRPTTDILMGQTKSPVNSGLAHHYVECAAFEQLDGWVAGRSKPPSAPRLDVTADGRDLHRDDLGIATGGIRTPWTDVPTCSSFRNGAVRRTVRLPVRHYGGTHRGRLGSPVPRRQDRLPGALRTFPGLGDRRRIRAHRRPGRDPRCRQRGLARLTWLAGLPGQCRSGHCGIWMFREELASDRLVDE